jgi:hypothetical protein
MSSIPPSLPPAVPVMPYASPAGLTPSGAVYRQGQVLIVYKGSTLPPRCVKCNAEPDKPPILRKFTWHHPAAYFGLLAGLIPFAIIAICIQKKGDVYLSVCKKHRARRAKVMLIAWVVAALGFVSVIGGFVAASNNGYDSLIMLIPIGFILLIAAAVFGILAGRYLAPKRIDDHYLYLKGACDEYLNTLPGVSN